MRVIRFAAAAALLSATVLGGGAAFAADPTPAPAPAAAPPAAAPAKPADPVIAKVDGQDIHMSELQEAAAQIPEEYRNLPPQILYPQLVEQLVDRRALLKMAQAQKLDQDPQVKKAVQHAAEQALQNALISREVGPSVTDAAIKARYDSTLGGKPGEEEVHARHILVANEADAKSIIDQLKKGADFATLAKAHSTDPGAANGGDLGFFKKADMLPEFSAVAFALQPGQISETPVHTRYGWHVIRVEEHRTAPPPSYEQSHDELRQTMIQEGIQKVVKEARNGVTVEKFNPDGSVPKATDTATPPAALPATPTAPPSPPAAPSP